MKITRCQGAEVHFFDGDKYSVCPVCGKPSVENGAMVEQPKEQPAAAPVKPEKEEKVKHKFFGGGRKNQKTDVIVPNIDVEAPRESGTVAMEDVCTDLNKTVTEDTNPPLTQAQPAQREVSQSISQVIPEIPPMPAPRTANSDYDSAKTVGVYANAFTEPVTGWLICVKGESQGESFNLKAGKNAIGRGAGMDVMLAQEKSVSRDKHAIITYEPKKRIFLLQPGESSGLVYLNDELLMSYSEIKPYDKIQLGDALFVFIPFCGEQFTWDDYISKE